MATTRTGSTATSSSAATGGGTGQRTPDVTYDLVSVVYHALQGCQTYQQYAQDADEAGQPEVAQFFNEVMQEDQRRADRGQQLLMQCFQKPGQGGRTAQMHSQGQGSQGQQGSSGTSR
jgi:hypothetical protein